MSLARLEPWGFDREGSDKKNSSQSGSNTMKKIAPFTGLEFFSWCATTKRNLGPIQHELGKKKDRVFPFIPRIRMPHFPSSANTLPDNKILNDNKKRLTKCLLT